MLLNDMLNLVIKLFLVIGKDIEMAIKDLSGIHVVNLQPNREQGEKYICNIKF